MRQLCVEGRRKQGGLPAVRPHGAHQYHRHAAWAGVVAIKDTARALAMSVAATAAIDSRSSERRNVAVAEDAGTSVLRE